MQEVGLKRPRAIVAAVQLPSGSDVELDASLSELRQLAKTLDPRVLVSVACASGLAGRSETRC